MLKLATTTVREAKLPVGSLAVQNNLQPEQMAEQHHPIIKLRRKREW